MALSNFFLQHHIIVFTISYLSGCNLTYIHCCDVLAVLGTKMKISDSFNTMCIERGCLTNNRRAIY